MLVKVEMTVVVSAYKVMCGADGTVRDSESNENTQKVYFYSVWMMSDLTIIQ